MFTYKDIAGEWDRLNMLTPEEADELYSTIEDGSFEAMEQFNFQLGSLLFKEAKELSTLNSEDSKKIFKTIGDALFSGYLIFISYQNLLKNTRKPKKGIAFNPTLMEEYNETVAPQSPNPKSEEFNNLLDKEPATEMLIDKVALMEMNLLRKNLPQIENLKYSTGDLIKSTLDKAVFIGFCIAFAENSLK